MKIKIGKKKYECDATTSTTQRGNLVVRVTSETAPVAENGFVLYTDDESMEFDRSDYVYLYQSYGNVKEYTNVEEEVIPASGYISGIPESPIAKQFSALNKRVSDITPYTQTKKAYFGEVEKVFYGVPQGNLTVFCDAECTTNRIEDRLTVKFAERLDKTVDVTIMVQ